MIFNRRLPSWIRAAYYYDSIGGFLYGIFYGSSIAFFPIIARKIGATSHEMALLSTLPFIGALFTFWWAHLSTGKKKMPFLVKSKVIARTTLLLMVFAFRPWVFLLILSIYWFLEFAAGPAYVGIIKDIYPERERGKATGYVRVELALAAILATYLGGILLDRISYRFVFPIGAFMGIIAISFFRRIRVESDKSIESLKERFSLLSIIDTWRKDKIFFHYSLILFLYGFGFMIALPIYPMFLVDSLHISNTDAGRIASVFSIFWLISYLFWGEYIDKRSPLKALCPIIAIASAVPFLYSLADNLWMVALATAFSGMASGGGELARIGYITRLANETNIQRYCGIDYSLMGIRGITAPFIGIGLMKLVGMSGVFMISSSLVFLAFLLMTIFRNKLER